MKFKLSWLLVLFLAAPQLSWGGARITSCDYLDRAHPESKAFNGNRDKIKMAQAYIRYFQDNGYAKPKIVQPQGCSEKLCVAKVLCRAVDQDFHFQPYINAVCKAKTKRDSEGRPVGRICPSAMDCLGDNSLDMATIRAVKRHQNRNQNGPANRGRAGSARGGE